MYELRDRTGVVATGSLEQIRAKVHELSHHERQDRRVRESQQADQKAAIRGAVDRYLEALAQLQPAWRTVFEANHASRAALDADEDTTQALLHCQATDATLERVFRDLEATYKRLSEFDPEELREHDDSMWHRQ